MWSIKYIPCNICMCMTSKNTIFFITFVYLWNFCRCVCFRVWFFFFHLWVHRLYIIFVACLSNSNSVPTIILIHICNIDTIIRFSFFFFFFVYVFYYFFLLASFYLLMPSNLLLSFEIDRKLNVIFQTVQYLHDVFFSFFFHIIHPIALVANRREKRCDKIFMINITYLHA